VAVAAAVTVTAVTVVGDTPLASSSSVRRTQSSAERASSSGKRSMISVTTAAVGGVVARGVTEESEEERVLLLPARLGVLEGAGVLWGGGVLEGCIQVEEEVWRHLLSWGERMVLGRMVSCNMPSRSWVGVPKRETSESARTYSVCASREGRVREGGKGTYWGGGPKTRRRRG